MTDPGQTSEPPVHGFRALVDIHAHFHPSFDEVRFFRSALANLSDAAGALGIQESWTGVLVLTEGAGSGAFKQFLDRTLTSQSGPLVFEATEEAASVSVREFARDRTREPHLVVVAGRQIRAEEDLEVLAFPLLEAIPDGLPLEEAIGRSLESGAVVVLPWGFGKWLAGRGDLVARIVEERRSGDVFLADTGHRPRLFPLPKVLKRGEAASVPVLAGSDPLPLTGEDRRPGSSCILLESGHEWGSAPGLALREAIRSLSGSPPRFQSAPSLWRFTFAQVAMQIRKHLERQGP